MQRGVRFGPRCCLHGARARCGTRWQGRQRNAVKYSVVVGLWERSYAFGPVFPMAVSGRARGHVHPFIRTFSVETTRYSCPTLRFLAARFADWPIYEFAGGYRSSGKDPYRGPEVPPPSCFELAGTGNSDRPGLRH